MEKNQSNIEWMSTLRGTAVFMVFFSHLPLVLPFDILFIIGRVAVVVFFLMTGYLSVSSRRKRSGKQYLFNRFMRMYPVYWLLLVLAYAVSSGGISFKRFAANLTLFEEFMGQEPILGGSWMMPMQVCFFIFIAIAGSFLFDKKFFNMSFEAVMILITVLLALAAFATGFFRHMTGLPLPTAFFLLISVSFLGMTYNYSNSRKTVIVCFGIFEIGLVSSVILSYPDMIASYIVAYNLGFLLFFGFEKLNASFALADKLGSMGFTFFLGADILYKVVCRYVDFGQSYLMTALGCVVKFVLALLLAYIVTRFVEKPLLARAGRFEKKIACEEK